MKCQKPDIFQALESENGRNHELCYADRIAVYIKLELAMHQAIALISQYLSSDKPKVCELEKTPYLCEFWLESELAQFNQEYEVELNAPGYFAFATSGGGELIALSPSGSVVCLPCIGMESKAAIEIAPNWADFERQLNSAL